MAQEGQRAWVACSNLPLDRTCVAAIGKRSLRLREALHVGEWIKGSGSPFALSLIGCQCRELHW